jgi:anti-sigma factor RsiW
MSLPRGTVMELMALADGELEGEARTRAEALVAANAEARRFVEATRGEGLKRLLEAHAAEKSVAGGADSIAQAVMANVYGVAKRPPVSISKRRPPPSPRMQGQLRIAAVGFGVAMAAGVALYLSRRAPPASEPAEAKVELAPAGGKAEGVEVDEIDSPTHDISVFEIPGSAAAAAATQTHPSSVVIWVEDGTGSK